MKNLLRRISFRISPLILLFVYKLLAFFSPKYAFDFTQWTSRLLIRYPRTILLPEWSSIWCQTAPGLVLCSPQDWVSFNIVRNGCWEPLISHTIERLLHPGDVFIDIGAHIGSHTLIASRRVGPKGLVVAIEPLPENINSLSSLIVKNELTNVTMIGMALSNKNESLLLYAGNSENFGQSSFRSISNKNYPIISARLDALIPVDLWHRVRLIKMDVEGAELLAIQGMDKLFESHTCDFILCEVTSDYLKEMGSSAESLISHVSSYGYIPFWTEKQSTGAWQPIAQNMSFDRQVDVLFVKKDSLDAFEHQYLPKLNLQ